MPSEDGQQQALAMRIAMDIAGVYWLVDEDDWVLEVILYDTWAVSTINVYISVMYMN